jgi:hypothetical protein
LNPRWRPFRTVLVLGIGGQKDVDRRADHGGGMTPGFSTQFCDVEIDPETG